MLTDGAWQARIISDPTFLQDSVRILFFRRVGSGLYESIRINSPLIIDTVPEGTSIADSGILMPASMIRAIRDSIDEWQGIPKTNAEAENKVLREVLAKEQERVDRILDGE